MSNFSPFDELFTQEALDYASSNRLPSDSFHVHNFNIYTKLRELEKKVNDVIYELNLKQEK